MAISAVIQKLRKAKGLSQEQFSELFHVSQQSVQKWESGVTTPDLEKIILMAKYFDMSIDELVLGHTPRELEILNYNRELKPHYERLQPWEAYAADLDAEYQQCLEEGLDIGIYKDVFSDIALLPMNEIKKKFSDVLFDAVRQAPLRRDYPYVEPSDLEGIRALRKPFPLPAEIPPGDILFDKVYGAWMGRISGCMYGKSIEGIRSNELIPFLRETGNYPLHRYIYRSDLNEERISKYEFGFSGRLYADEIKAMPSDDDTNYTVMAQLLIDEYGRDFTPYDVSRSWLLHQPKEAYCTAERVAFCNFIRGYEPPGSAVYQNPYREWIGAQIRGDYFGYINPGDPEKAAEMAFRDASVSHIKNGIYGEMFIAAMIACAAVSSDIADVIRGGLAQIPASSRLYESVTDILRLHESGRPFDGCLALIRSRYDEYTAYGWCHTVGNAMIVAASLLYGGKDFGKTVSLAVGCAYDTDCNGATAGSVLGMMIGYGKIDPYWTKPFCDTLMTSICGIPPQSVTELAKHTLDHMR